MAAVLTRTQIDQAGILRSEIDHALRCCMVRVRRGVYVIRSECEVVAHEVLRACVHRNAGGGPDIDDPGLRGHTAKLRLLVDSYRTSLSGDCAFSHLSAALIWGLPITGPVQSRVEAIRPSRSYEYRQLKLRKRPLPEGDVTRVEGARVTTALRTLVDIAHDYPLEVSVPMIDHALRTGLLERHVFAELSGDLPARRGVIRARTALSLADPARESPAESICAVRFHELGMEGFVPQVVLGIEVENFVARVDFLHRAAKVIVEVNGEIKYTDGERGARRARQERHRDYRLRNLGYRVFQLAWSDLFSTDAFHEIKRAIAAAS